MRKLFTLLMVLAVATVGYSQVRAPKSTFANTKTAQAYQAPRMEAMEALQNVVSIPSMTRSDGELDYSTYDWQSNDAARTWTIVWPDGKVNFCYTWASDNSYSDRGTAIGTYDSNTDDWLASGGRVEQEKTGFGSIARYRDNSILVAAHTSTMCGVYLVEDKDNITAGCAELVSYLDPTNDPTWPAIMTSGPDRDIVHVVALGYSDNVIYYFRSKDGGQTWDKQNVVLPFLTPEYGSTFNSNCYHWLELGADNRLSLVINNAWSDGMVLYSFDDGETWEREVYYSHPNINGDFTDTWFMYPRWAEAVWQGDKLNIAYEFNGSTGESGSGSYYPAIGGVAYWSNELPYRGDGTNPSAIPGNLTPGQPFVMDSAYMYTDIYASWWLWSDASHETWNEYIGYLPALTDDGEWEDPEVVTEFNIDDRSLHGSYNSGVAHGAVLCEVPGTSDLVAVWCTMDENHTDGAGNFYMHLFASYSADGGFTWQTMKHLASSWMFDMSEMVYPQAAVVGNTLVIACQEDGYTGTYVQSDDPDPTDNFYHGLTYDLTELFESVSVPEVVSHNTKMAVYPNPAIDRLSVTLNQDAEIVIYNIMGQVVSTVNGHAGENVISIDNLSSGVYFVNAGTETQKFVVK